METSTSSRIMFCPYCGRHKFSVVEGVSVTKMWTDHCVLGYLVRKT